MAQTQEIRNEHTAASGAAYTTKQWRNGAMWTFAGVVGLSLATSGAVYAFDATAELCEAGTCIHIDSQDVFEVALGASSLAALVLVVVQVRYMFAQNRHYKAAKILNETAFT